MENTNNLAELVGIPGGKPVFSHSGRSENYYTFPLEVERLSGTVDTVNIIVREQLLKTASPGEGDKLSVIGEVRSFNNRSGVGSRLIVSVFARELSTAFGENRNLITLSGTVCRPPNFRRTPMGREICDIMLAVNRRYGRSDYIPCIAWGSLGRQAAELEVGTPLSLTGRLQSRKYIKMVEGGSVEKIAYEVSAVELTMG